MECIGMFIGIVIGLGILYWQTQKDKKLAVEKGGLPGYYKSLWGLEANLCLINRFFYHYYPNYDGKNHDKHSTRDDKGNWLEWETDDQGNLTKILINGHLCNKKKELLWFEGGELQLKYFETNVVRDVVLFGACIVGAAVVQGARDEGWIK